MNVSADLFSHLDQTLPAEWSLNPEVTRHMFHLWGSPLVDLFAIWWNTKLPNLVSPLPDTSTLAVNSLCLPWQNLWPYVFPPHQLLTEVLTKLCQSNTELLVALVWPAKPWFPDLLELSIDHP